MRVDSFERTETSAAELENLMLRYQQADRSAASELIRTASPMLFRYFSASGNSRRHADDLIQETWMRVHRARHTFRAGNPVLPWLFAIARHARIDHFRKLSRVERREVQMEILPEVEPPPSGAGAEGIDMSAVLHLLPESQREVIVMLKVSGLSMEQVARATSSTLGAVKQKAHRAYKTIGAFLQERRSRRD